jgi:hypothetical protein
MEVRLGCLNCPFPCSSVAISTDLNCGETVARPAAIRGRPFRKLVIF